MDALQIHTPRAALVALTLALALTTGVTRAPAQSPTIAAGTLTCQGEGAVGLIVGSKEHLRCKFAPAGGGYPNYYVGTTTRIGLDVGVRGKSVMVWTVLGSTTELPDEALGGTFAGVSADVAAGLGVGANVLVGGNEKSVVLQPLSVKGGTGLNLAVGISGLELRPER